MTRFISMREVRNRTSLSKTTIHKRINAGTFPRPVGLGGSRVAFVEAQVEAWMKARVSDRQDRAIRLARASKATRSRQDRRVAP
jgi:prophage regulatory protein